MISAKKRLRLAQIVCKFLPPIAAQRLRTKLFPRHISVDQSQSFRRRAITGSIFVGETSDLHSYSFSVHGYFDWRNVIIANILLKESPGEVAEVGANIGTETICFCDIARPQTVYAFEPLPANVQRLERIPKANNNIDNLSIFPFAISNRVAEETFLVPYWTNSGNGRITKETTPPGATKIRVKTFPLDSFIDKFKVLKLISIDVEGHEVSVLDGASEVIEKFRPYIIIEISNRVLKLASNTSDEQIFDYFSLRGYSCYEINRFSVKKMQKQDLGCETDKNWLCLPEENDLLLSRIKRELWIKNFTPWNRI